MLKKFKKNANIVGIGDGASATVAIPAKGTLYSIILKCSGSGSLLTAAQIKSDIEKVQLDLDGDTKIDLTSTEILDLIQKYPGDSQDAGNVNGYVYIPLTPYHLPNSIEREAFAYGLEDVDNVTLNIECAASLSNLDTVEVYLERTEERRPLGQHFTFKSYPQVFSTTGEQEISDLPHTKGGKGVVAMHIGGYGSAVLEEVTVEYGDTKVFDQVTQGVNELNLKRSKRTPQSGYTHIDFSVSNDAQGFLPMPIHDWRQTLTWGTAAPSNYNIVVVTLEGLKTR